LLLFIFIFLKIAASLDEDPTIVATAQKELTLKTMRDEAALKKSKMIEREQQRLGSIKPTDLELLREVFNS
jgi:esterase/lipase superfamily enzyme